MSKADDERREAKRKVVVGRLREMEDSLDILSGMLSEQTLDALILAFGLGHVEIDS